MHEVETLEWMVFDNASKEMNSTLLAGVTLNGRGRVDNMEFVGIGGDRKFVHRDYADNREQCAFWLPAF